MQAPYPLRLWYIHDRSHLKRCCRMGNVTESIPTYRLLFEFAVHWMSSTMTMYFTGAVDSLLIVEPLHCGSSGMPRIDGKSVPLTVYSISCSLLSPHTDNRKKCVYKTMPEHWSVLMRQCCCIIIMTQVVTAFICMHTVIHWYESDVSGSSVRNSAYTCITCVY